MPRVVVIGGGLAGLSCAAALGAAGFDAEVFEARGFPGGRATSYPWTGPDEGPVFIDNCQHVLLRCCTNLLDFYERLGVAGRIRFYREFYFIEPGGRVSLLRGGRLPAPLHLASSFLRLRFLSAADKLAIGWAMAAVRREYPVRDDLDSITMLDWLREKRQTARAIERFWRQVLVSAINEDLDRMAARHGLQVMWLGFLAARDSYEMGVPAVPLSELYSAEAWRTLSNVHLRFRAPVERVIFEEDQAGAIVANGAWHTGDFYVCAVPFERLPALAPELGIDWAGWEHSPITGIHLWFDRPVTKLPHATLLGRTIQWFFNKSEGRYLQLVVSASRGLLRMDRAEVIETGLRELAEFLPGLREAKLEKAHVVKEARATFSAAPGMEARRPDTATRFRNFFLAGDWTRSGWPATMEGAVRSGYLAAEALCAAAGRPARFLRPDIA
jgi:squalene-associated FAD-dependent desaturase